MSGIFEEKEGLSYYGVAIMLMMVGIAVYLFKSSREMNIYRKLLQIDDFAPDQKKIDQKLSTFASVYWEVLTAVYLIWSFLTNDWGFTWVIWPVGAILYAAVYAILSAVVAKNLR